MSNRRFFSLIAAIVIAVTVHAEEQPPLKQYNVSSDSLDGNWNTGEQIRTGNVHIIHGPYEIHADKLVEKGLRTDAKIAVATGKPVTFKQVDLDGQVIATGNAQRVELFQAESKIIFYDYEMENLDGSSQAAKVGTYHF